MSTVPTASMTTVAAPAPARIWVGSTAGSHAGPKTQGMTTGARSTRHVSGAKTTTVSSRTMRRRSANISSGEAVRASTGNAIWVIIELILVWYSTASWKPRQ